MWIEWTLGRYGGGFEHGTAPGIFHSVWEKNRFIKYFGVIGIFGPLVIFIYYTYIESWTLAYSFFALIGKYSKLTDQASMQSFLNGFQGLVDNFFRDMGHFCISINLRPGILQQLPCSGRLDLYPQTIELLIDSFLELTKEYKDRYLINKRLID
jgi:SNF family Na+-dependent transporter